MTTNALRRVFTRVNTEIQALRAAEAEAELAREEWERRERSIRDWKELMQRL